MPREPMRDVISCSRRTDVPAFHYDWLQGVLAEGRAELVNPYSGTPYSVDLSIDRVHSIVLWSKDFGNVLKDPGMLDAYNLYFQFTVTGYGRPLEPRAPETGAALRQMAALTERYSPRQVMWRFDPILLLQSGPDPVAERLDAFRELSYAAASMGIEECTVSFAAFYPGVRARLDRCGARYYELDAATKASIGRELVDIAGENGMVVRSCSDPALAGVPCVERARCIDGERLEELFGHRVSHAKDPGQREACGCSKSRDIGQYTMRCDHGCTYCFAAQNHKIER